MSDNRASTEHKQSVDNFGCGIWYNPRAKLWFLSIIKVVAGSMDNVVNVVVTPRRDECQQTVRIAST